MSWEAQKENIQPISQGRNIEALMRSLTLVTDNKAKAKLIADKKETFDKELDEAKDDSSKRLDLWCDYIDWLEQHVPEGGKVNGLTNAIEQCIEEFYTKSEFKQDERLFNVFMKFKRFCDEPTEVFGFMYANSIATLLSNYYLNWSWQYEIRKNMKRAQDIIKLGIKNLATPQDVLKEAMQQIQFRLDRMIRSGELDDLPESRPTSNREIQAELANRGIRAALQTMKFRVTKEHGSKVPINRTGFAVDENNVGGLKSQTHVVNGVRMPKKKAATRNSPIDVLPETDENAPAPAIIEEIPTSTRIGLVGRRGLENSAPIRNVGMLCPSKKN